MYYEQDYIMRLIKQVIRALIGILLNKKTTMEYEMPVNRQQTSGEDFLARLISLADAGKICDAENELSDILESGSDPAFQIALMFYDHLNNYNDSFLEDTVFAGRRSVRGFWMWQSVWVPYTLPLPLWMKIRKPYERV